MKPIVPPAILQLWDQGRHVEAIKGLRQVSGLGLKEAKDLLESVRPLDEAQPKALMSADAEAAWVALLTGNPIEAIRRARAAAEAAQKQTREPPPPPTRAATLEDLQARDPNRAPGEVPAGFFSGPNGLLSLLALGGLAWFVWLLLN